VFTATDPFPGLNPKLRRAISQVEFDAPYIVKCIEACAKLKLKAVTPIYKPDVWSHVGIPSHKVAFYFRTVYDAQRIERDRALWKAHGWTMFFAITDSVTKMTVDELAGHLKSAIGGIVK
jgi:hypothetical protein